MELKILEDKKNKLVVETDSRTVAGILKSELWNDSSVTASGIVMNHPLVGKPSLVVQTKAKGAREALSDAVKRSRKGLEKIKKALK